jgi:putative ABC transport system permease protein
MLAREFVHAARGLRKSPIFLITAVATIALGIGASTAIFSVANGVLLRPLPYKDPDRLVVIGGDMRTRSVFDERISYESWADLRDGGGSVFEDVAGVSTFQAVLPAADGTPEQVRIARVTANLFRLLGAHIVAGRDFDLSDADPGPPPDPAAGPAPPPNLPIMAIISYEYWQRRFGGSTAILGHALSDRGGSVTVVGVLAPGFELEFRASSNVARGNDIFTAMRLRYDNRNRNGYFLRGIARLKPGVTLDRVQQVAGNVAAEIRRNFTLYGTAQYYYHIEPMGHHLVAEVRPAILALLGAVIFLLLIACANVANLLLVRMSLRERDLAVRAALGGSRARLIREVIVEALLVAGAGTLLGVGLAYAGIRELIAISPENLPRLENISIDPTVLLFSTVAGVAAAMIFGIVPALRASRPDVMQVLRGAGRNAGLAGGGVRNTVAIVEVALSFVLLVGSGLMVRSFIALQRFDLGFDPNHLLTLQTLGRPVQPQARAAQIRQIETALRETGGVQGITAATLIPLGGGWSTIRWGRENALADPSKFQAADTQVVLPGFFETLGTPLIAGRTFEESDNAPERNVVIVDQLLAAKAFPNEPAVGKRILIRIRTPEPEWVEIIGVVAHQRATSIAEPGHEQLYFTDGFLGHGAVNHWMIRTAGDPAAMGGAVRSAIRKVDAGLLVNEVHPMNFWVDRAQASTRFSLLLIGTFAVMAGILAAVGLYGVLATFVRQRTAEIGVRMAMGAAPSNIFALVVGQGLRLSAFGVGLGVIAAMLLTRAMSSLLVGVTTTDPATFGVIVIFFFFIAALACWIPALRASALDPTIALREE